MPCCCLCCCYCRHHCLGHQDNRGLHPIWVCLGCGLFQCSGNGSVGGGVLKGWSPLLHLGLSILQASPLWEGVQSPRCLNSWRGHFHAPLPLLPNFLWPQTPWQLGSQSCVCHLPCCYMVLQGCRFSCHGQETRIMDPSSAVPPVLPPLCVPVHQPVDAWSSLASWCIEAEKSLLSYGCLTGCSLKGKRTSHSAMMLTSLITLF